RAALRTGRQDGHPRRGPRLRRLHVHAAGTPARVAGGTRQFGRPALGDAAPKAAGGTAVPLSPGAGPAPPKPSTPQGFSVDRLGRRSPNRLPRAWFGCRPVRLQRYTSPPTRRGPLP